MIQDVIFKSTFENFEEEKEKYKRKLLNAKSSQSNNNDLYDFEIIKKKINTIKKDSLVSYTFGIKRETNTTEFFENLVLTVYKNGEVKSHLLRYIYEENSQLETVEEGFGFNGVIKTVKLDYKRLQFQGKYEEDCVDNFLTLCTGSGQEAGACTGKPHIPSPQCLRDYSHCIGMTYVGRTCSGSFSGGGGVSYDTTNPHSTGGGGGTSDNNDVYTSPVVYPCGDEIHNCTKKADIIATQLQLTFEEREWLRDQSEETILFYENFLVADASIQAQNWAKGQIELETLTTHTTKIKTYYNPGKIRGRDDLNYTHIGSDGIRTVYNLVNGDVVVSSNTKLVINNFENGFWTSETSNDNFWYIKTRDTGEWAQFLIQENYTSLSDELGILFKLAGLEISKMLGTYVIPVEDFKILITGSDFNGQPTSRWLAAGMLLMEVVPGGKMLKPLVKTSKVVTTPLKIAVKEGGGYVVKSLGKVVNVEITTSVINDAIQYLSETGVELARVTNNVLTVSKHKIKAKTGSLVFMGENEINAIMKGKGYPDPPFKGAATEFVSEQAEQFVRFHNASNPNRSWMMKLSDVENFTNLDQVRNAFSLDASNIMDKVSSFTVPAGKKMYAGTANGLYGFDGGGYQFFIDGNVDINWKGVTKTITDFFN